MTKQTTAVTTTTQKSSDQEAAFACPASVAAAAVSVAGSVCRLLFPIVLEGNWFVLGRKTPKKMSVNGNKSLEEVDPKMFDLIEREKNRQW